MVKVKGFDTPEESNVKLRAIKESVNRSEETPKQREARFNKYFGSIKFDGDPVELQRKWRDEWE